jgi:iron complex outermembrane receptor protein
MLSKIRSGRLSRAIQITLGIASGAFAPYAVHAQTAPAQESQELSEVIVTGFRASLEAALEVKRQEAGSVDAIVAEDIADFPDLNLAESIQRVPGVAITRDAGEGRNISVRGLGADFTRIRINGMEALTTAGGTDSSGGTNRGRGFDFNIFASELFNQITVRKSASADVEEGSLGATVDLATARPFDYDGFTFVTSAQMGYNDLSSDSNPRAAVLISSQFADGTLGALLSVAYTDRSLSEEGFSTVRWAAGNANNGFSGTPSIENAATFHPRIPRYGALEHEQERLGLTASFQWKPTDASLLSLDILHADFDATRTESFLEAISFSRGNASGTATPDTGKPETVVVDSAVDGRGNVVYGLFNGVDVRSELRYDELETKFTQFNLSGSHEFSDRLKVSALLGYSESLHDNPIQTTITIDRVDTNGYSWDFRGNDRLPYINYGFDVTSPDSWTFGLPQGAATASDIRLRPQTADNTFKVAQLDSSFALTDQFTLNGGLLLKQYEFETTEKRRLVAETIVPALPAGVSLASVTRLRTGYGAGLGVPGGLYREWLEPDINAFNNVFNIYSNTGTFAVSSDASSARGNNRKIEEEDTGVYVQLDWDFDIGIPVRGNIGARYVETEQTSTGFAVVGGSPVLTTVSRKYDDFLPSLNAVAEVTDSMLIRLGVAKVMARPGLGNLTPGVQVSVSGGQFTVQGGNPNLDPFRATTVDLAGEWYFAPESLLSAALFYKDIDSFVQTSRETRPFNTSGLPDSLATGVGASPTDPFQFNIPLNTPGGDLKGFELSYQQPFSFLPGIWSNFGAIANYTYVDSKIQYLTSAGLLSLNTDLVGLSRYAYNGTVYFDNSVVSGRLSAAYRDDYLTTVPGRDGNLAADGSVRNDVEGTHATFSLDAAFSWSVTDKLELTLEALNLTDEFNDQYIDSTGDRVVVYHHTGRQYFVGARYKL